MCVGPLHAASMSDGFSVQFSAPVNGGASSPWLLNTQNLVAADRPMISIRNTSDEAEITKFSITMGDSTFSFGSLLFLPQNTGINVTDFSPIATAGLHADVPTASLSFDGFGAGETYKFRADIDRTADHGKSLTQFGQALASGNDSSKWATMSVTFSDGTVLNSQITPDDVSGSGTYSYYYCWYNTRPVAAVSASTSNSGPPVPEPATASLGSLAFVGLLAYAARARYKRRPARQ